VTEKLDDCPRCGKSLSQAGYDLQHCPCGWDRLAGLEDNPYQGTIVRLEPSITPIDTAAALASISISLKRIADALSELRQGAKDKEII
jgi:hypothetical protein